MKSRVFSSDILKSQFHREIWLPILAAIGFFLAFPVAELLMIGNWVEQEYNVAQIHILVENLYRDGLIYTGMVVIVATAFLNAMWGYFYLYSREKIDFYHSLPVTRLHLFFRKLISALLYGMVPYLVMLLLAILTAVARGYYQSSILGLALLMLGKHLLIYLLTYFCVALVICMTGNVLMGVLSLGGFFFYFEVLAVLLNEYEDLFFNTHARISGITGFFLRLTPVYVYGSVTALSGISWLIILLLTILLAVFTGLAYRKRPSESTGKSMVYGWFGEIVKFMIVIPCGLAAGAIFGEVARSSSREPWWLFGIVLGTVLAKGLMEVLYELDFRAFFRNKAELIAALGIVCVLTACYRYDFLKYDTYLPSYSRIADIRLNAPLPDSGWVASPARTNDGSHTYWISVDWKESLDAAEVTAEDGSISYVIDENRNDRICKDQKELGPQIYEALQDISKTGFDFPEDGHCTMIWVHYDLKSGLEVSRRYRVTPEQLQKLYYAILSESNQKETTYSALNLDEKYLKEVDAYLGVESVTLADGSQSDKEKGIEILNALREDVADATFEDLSNAFPVCEMYFYYQDVPVKETVNNLVPNKHPVSSPRSCFYIYPTFKRTVAILEKAGYPLSVQDLDITEARIRVYDWKSGQSYGYFAADEKAQVEEIKASAIWTEFDVPWLRTADATAYMEVKPDDYAEYEETFVFPADQVPDFVQAWITKAYNGELEEVLYEDEDDYDWDYGDF